MLTSDKPDNAPNASTVGCTSITIIVTPGW